MKTMTSGNVGTNVNTWPYFFTYQGLKKGDPLSLPVDTVVGVLAIIIDRA
jgi:hypothetical protein